MHLETHRLAQRFDRPPARGAFFEPADHLVDAESALHFELAVTAVARTIDARRRDIGAENIDRPAEPLLGLFGEKHGERIDFLAGGAARRPDSQPPGLLAALGKLGQRMALEQVERRPVAEEIGFVVEQRFDHLLRQARLGAHDENGDELVERGDLALAHQRGKRGLDAPAAAQGQLLSGTRLEQAGEDATRAVAYLHES